MPSCRLPEVKRGRPAGVTRLRTATRALARRGRQRGLPRRHVLPPRCRPCGRARGERSRALPFHGLRYAADGRVVAIPANGLAAEVPENFRVRPWLAVDAFGFVWVFYGKPADVARRPADVRRVPGRLPVRRALRGVERALLARIENQLDVVHLPFVHPNTIGRGHKTLVNGPVTKWDDETLNVLREERARPRPDAAEGRRD